MVNQANLLALHLNHPRTLDRNELACHASNTVQDDLEWAQPPITTFAPNLNSDRQTASVCVLSKCP